jgi:pSer/pThr/pTyr-binding forkhead associated (FHA) protein
VSKLTLSFKGKPLKVVPLDEGEMVIGSDPGSPIHIDSLAVQPRHASVVVRGAQSILRDLGTPDGTFVNGQRLTGDHLLRDNDNVRVGKHNLVYTHEAPVAAPAEPEAVDSNPPLEVTAPPKSAWLQILNGQNVGKTIGLNKNLVNLGKTGVQTAVIARRNEGYFLSHLEGEHSPLVNGAAIGERSHHLQDGDTIQIGNIKMQFYLQ